MRQNLGHFSTKRVNDFAYRFLLKFFKSFVQDPSPRISKSTFFQFQKLKSPLKALQLIVKYNFSLSFLFLFFRIFPESTSTLNYIKQPLLFLNYDPTQESLV